MDLGKPWHKNALESRCNDPSAVGCFTTEALKMIAHQGVLLGRSVTQFIAHKGNQNHTLQVGSSHADDTHNPKRTSGGDAVHLIGCWAMKIFCIARVWGSEPIPG